MKKYFYNLDLLKFVFIISIILFHVVYLKQYNAFGFDWFRQYFKFGNVAVSLFFVISGFFLAYRYKENQSVFGWVKGRFFQFVPMLLVVTLLFYGLHLMGYIDFNVPANIENVLLIHDWVGKTRWGQAVHPAWFLSVLVLVSAYLLGLRKAVKNENMFLLLLCLSMFVGWRVILFASSSEYSSPLVDGRAIFCIGFGWLLAKAYADKNKDEVLTDKQKVIWTGAEFISLFLILQRMFVGKSTTLSEMLYILLFGVLLWSFVNGYGWIGNWLNNKKFANLGKIVFPIFIGHIFVLDFARLVLFPECKAFVSNNTILSLVFLVLASVLFGIALHRYVELPVNRYLKGLKNEEKSDS